MTDSILQDRLASGWMLELPIAQRVFAWGYSTNADATRDMKLVSVNDPVNYVIVADGGWLSGSINPGTLAYPELCLLQCSACDWYWVDWEMCASDAADCGLYNLPPNDGSFLRDPSLRKRYSRHLGGNNLGYLDGHAQWMHAEAALVKIKEGDLEGIDSTGKPNSLCGAAESYPDMPLLY